MNIKDTEVEKKCNLSSLVVEGQDIRCQMYRQACEDHLLLVVNELWLLLSGFSSTVSHACY